MKKYKIITGILIACLCLIFLSDILAQAPKENLEKIKTEMQSLSAWTGHWRGEGIMQMGPGQSASSTVNEFVQFKLDSTVLLVEGIGMRKDESTGKEIKTHHALGLLSFNPHTNSFEFKSHLADGNRTDAWFKRLEENKYQWGFDTPQGKIRYDIVLNPKEKTWKETGEYSQDGNKWFKFFEMNLTKVKDTL